MDPTDQATQRLLFEGLLIFRQFRNRYPSVILNAHHEPPPPPWDTAAVQEAIAALRGAPSKARFAVLFAALRAADQTAFDSTVDEHLYDDGLLLLGPSWFQPVELIPGQYPFRNLRALRLDAEELARYRATPRLQLGEGHTLTVVGSELTAEAPTQWRGADDLTGGQFGLIATGVGNPEALKTAILAALDRARSERADVVLFPELTVDPPGLRVVEAWIAAGIASAEHVPPVIVAGSFYHPSDDTPTRTHNRATIYLVPHGAAGPTITHYDKRVPFSVSVPASPSSDTSFGAVLEAAKDAGKSVVVENFTSEDALTLVPTSLGMLAFAICRDVLDLAGTGNPLERYLDFADHVMVISYNDGVTWLFEAQGEDLARWHNSSLSYVNSRQALPTAAYAGDGNVVMGMVSQPRGSAAAGMSATLYFPDVQGKKSTTEITYRESPADGIMVFEISPSPSES